METTGIENEKVDSDHKTKRFFQKGSCNECDYYHNCPRMKGAGRCQNLGKEQVEPSPPIDPTADLTGGQSILE